VRSDHRVRPTHRALHQETRGSPNIHRLTSIKEDSHSIPRRERVVDPEGRGELTALSRLLVPINSDDRSLGPKDAPLSVVEYGDYECRYCGAAFPVVNEILGTFDGSLRYAYRNLPLESVHPRAKAAAEVAEAVGNFGYFWELHDMLYENQNALETDDLYRYAARTGVWADELWSELESGGPALRVQSDVEGAIRSGANGTPTFFVNGVRYDGSWEYEPFARYLDSNLIM